MMYAARILQREDRIDNNGIRTRNQLVRNNYSQLFSLLILRFWVVVISNPAAVT